MYLNLNPDIIFLTIMLNFSESQFLTVIGSLEVTFFQKLIREPYYFRISQKSSKGFLHFKAFPGSQGRHFRELFIYDRKI